MQFRNPSEGNTTSWALRDARCDTHSARSESDSATERKLAVHLGRIAEVSPHPEGWRRYFKVVYDLIAFVVNRHRGIYEYAVHAYKRCLNSVHKVIDLHVHLKEHTGSERRTLKLVREQSRTPCTRRPLSKPNSGQSGPDLGGRIRVPDVVRRKICELGPVNFMLAWA